LEKALRNGLKSSFDTAAQPLRALDTKQQMKKKT
jgi:hypothetical protein